MTDSTQINSVASTPDSDIAPTRPLSGSSGSEQSAADMAQLGPISGLVATAMDQPEVRMEKVDSIKAQIAAGTYEINPSKIADAIITSALDNDV